MDLLSGHVQLSPKFTLHLFSITSFLFSSFGAVFVEDSFRLSSMAERGACVSECPSEQGDAPAGRVNFCVLTLWVVLAVCTLPDA